MRLFAAVLPSPEVRDGLAEAVSRLQAAGTGTFPPEDTLHLTLAFIGETGDLDGAKAALAEACEGVIPFPVTTEGVGNFGDLWWAGIRENEALEQLALAVRKSLRERGFPIEERGWKPHITLARRYRGPEPTADILPACAMEVERVSLMRSDRSPGGGMVYTEVHCVELGEFTP